MLTKIRQTVLDGTTLLLAAGLWGFAHDYPHRFLLIVAWGLAVAGIWAVWEQRFDIAVPLATFLAATWVYNFFSGDTTALIMLIFLGLVSYGFWKLLGRPAINSLSSVHWVYFCLAIVLVWELAIMMQLFWQVEAWSRAFVVVAVMVFVRLAVEQRLTKTLTNRSLLPAIIFVLLLVTAVVLSTPISLG